MAEREKIKGKVVKASIGTARNDNKYASVELIPDGNEYAVTMRGWTEDVVRFCSTLQPDAWVSFTIELKDGEYQGKAIKYRNIIAVGDAEDRPTVTVKHPDDLTLQDEYIPEFDGPRTVARVLPNEGTDKDRLIVDQVLTKIAADIFASGIFEIDEAAERATEVAIELWNNIRSRHLPKDDLPDGLRWSEGDADDVDII